ncbi:hypothetical protein BV20DRAFT_946567, partial [Pilatotrama ljubarskyi]
PSPPPSSEEDIASVLARYLAVPLYEVLLPDHLRLRDRSSWADYKNAIVRVCALKGVKHHLRRPYHSAFEAWMKEDELCMALIKLNICDIGRLALPEYVFAADYWESLVALHEKRDVWAERKRRLREEVIKPMVLGMAGWVFVAFVVGFRHAIETISSLHGVGDNLNHQQMWPQPLRGCPISQEEMDERDEWQRKDELCKAVITLNIKDFPRYGIPAGKNTHANVVWKQLVQMHTKKRRCWEVLFGWVRPLTGLEKGLLVLVVALLWLHTLTVAEVRVTSRRY